MSAVGVIGLSGSGRTCLIEALEKNVKNKVTFHKLDYPDQGFTPAHLGKYAAHIKQLKSQYNLSMLLLLVPDSFRDKEAVLVQAAKQNNLIIAIVITQFDGSLDNIHPRKKTFTSAEKASLASKEKIYIKQELKTFNISEHVEIFHVSILAFPSELYDEKYCCDEKSLLQFIQNQPIQDNSLPKNQSNPAAVLTKAATIQSCNDEYDILFVGIKDSGTTIIRDSLKKINKQSDLKNFEYDESTRDVKTKVERIGRKFTVVVIKNHLDESLKVLFKHFQHKKEKFIVLLNTKNPEHSKQVFTTSNGCSIPSTSIFAFDFDQFATLNFQDPEILKFLDILQRETGINFKPEIKANHTQGVKRSIDSTADLHHGVLLIGLGQVNMKAIQEIVVQTNQGKNVKEIIYEKLHNDKEILHDIKSTERQVIIMVSNLLYNQYQSLMKSLNANPELDFILVLDSTRQHLSNHVSIQENKDRTIQHKKCFDMILGNGVFDERFMQYLGGSASRYDQLQKEEELIHF